MDEATPRGTFRQYVPCIVTAALGVGLSVAAAVTTMGFETRHAESQFQVLAQNHFMIVQNGLDEYVNRLARSALFSIVRTCRYRAPLSTSFTRPLLLENAAIATLSWVPRVRNADRAAFEHRGRAGRRSRLSHQGARRQRRDHARSGTERILSDILRNRAENLAALRSRSALGAADAGGNGERARPRSSGLFAGAVRSSVPASVKGGFLFSLPVYRHGAPHDSIEDRRRNLIGFVHGSLITSKMIDTIIAANKTPEGLDTLFLRP